MQKHINIYKYVHAGGKMGEYESHVLNTSCYLVHLIFHMCFSPPAPAPALALAPAPAPAPALSESLECDGGFLVLAYRPLDQHDDLVVLEIPPLFFFLPPKRKNINHVS